jgi:hypothetical protein
LGANAPEAYNIINIDDKVLLKNIDLDIYEELYD